MPKVASPGSLCPLVLSHRLLDTEKCAAPLFSLSALISFHSLLPPARAFKGQTRSRRRSSTLVFHPPPSRTSATAMSCSLPPTYTRHTILSTQASRRLHPYLGARARLSLSWLSQHFLALLLVLVALAFVSSSVSDLVKDGKRSLTAACAGVEGAANVAASLPHYMADGVNQLNSNTVTAVTHGVGTVLDLTLQALEAIIMCVHLQKEPLQFVLFTLERTIFGTSFMIDTYRSLFLCLLDLAVHGSLTLLVQAIEQAQEFVTEALSKVREGIQGAIGGINSGLEKSIGLIDKIPGCVLSVLTERDGTR